MSATAVLAEWTISQLAPMVLAELGVTAVRHMLEDAAARRTEQACPAESERCRVEPNIRILSTTPGRLRLSVAGLRRYPRAAATAARKLLATAGVRYANASPLTGNVLVEFDPRTVSAARICQLLGGTTRCPRALPEPVALRAPRLALVLP